MKNPVIFRVGRSRPPKIGCLLSFFVAVVCGISLFLVCCTSNHTDKENDTTETTGETTISIWEEKEFVDEFDNPTGEKFLQTTIKGTFSNSATTNENLSVIISIDKDSIIYFKFAEYNSHLVKREYLHGKVRGEKYSDGTWCDGVIGLSFDYNGIATFRPNDVGYYYSTHPTNYKERSFIFSDEREGGVPSTYSFKIEDISIFEEAYKRLNQ